MELERIQDLLSDAMAMAQDAEALPPHVDANDIDTVSAILAKWIADSGEGDDLASTRQFIVSALSCAFLAGQLLNMQVNDYASQTHRSETGNTYHIYNYFG